MYDRLQWGQTRRLVSFFTTIFFGMEKAIAISIGENWNEDNHLISPLQALQLVWLFEEIHPTIVTPLDTLPWSVPNDTGVDEEHPWLWELRIRLESILHGTRISVYQSIIPHSLQQFVQTLYPVAFPSELSTLIERMESIELRGIDISTIKTGSTIRMHVPTPTPGAPINKIFFLRTSNAWNYKSLPNFYDNKTIIKWNRFFVGLF